MLETAVRTVKRTGLTVSLEHISFEDVIRDAGVSRSAVYRRWPYKDLFFSDLLERLARDAVPSAVAEDEAAALIADVARERLDDLADPARRHGLVVELVRRGALRDFEVLQGLAEWRTYVALQATFLSLPEGELRDAIRDALGNAERTIVARVAARTRALAELLGYRLRPELAATFETVATLVSATVRGLVVMAPANPSLANERLRARPFGAQEAADWSQPALGTASILFSFLEPDPAVEWDAERIAEVRRALAPAA
jgi:AcrR family transcriptional regulator